MFFLWVLKASDTFLVFYFISYGLILDILNLMKKISTRLTDFIMAKPDILLSAEYEYWEVFQSVLDLI